MRNRLVIGWSWVVALIVVLTSAVPARAFYWYGWPGSKLPPERTVIGPQHKQKAGNPPERVPVGPANTVIPIPPNQGVPEPATATAALLGLGALAGLRALRRWREQKVE